MKLRRIFIPKTIKVKVKGRIDVNGEPVTNDVPFFAFLDENIFSDAPRMGKKASEQRKNLILLGEFEEAQKRADVRLKATGTWPTDVYVDVSEELWSKFDTICEEGPSPNPMAGSPGFWDPFYFKQFLPYFDAIQKAEFAPDPPPTDGVDKTKSTDQPTA